MSTGQQTGTVVRTEVTYDELVPADYEHAVSRRSAGAVVSFAGVVRDHDGGRVVRELTYEAHPSAADVLARVAADLLVSDPAVQAVAVGHRVGPLAIGDAALVTAVACAHRGAAFDACRRLVDEVKAQLPVWKHQIFADGTDEWVNCP